MTLFIIILVFVFLAGGLAWFLISHDGGQKEPILALWMAVGLGFAGALLAGFLEVLLLNTDDLAAGVPYQTVLASALGVGIIEEACKFLPLALIIYKRQYFNEHTDGVIYFALAGLGFGLPENILYTWQYGTEAGILRVFMTPMFHAATTGVVGYFLIRGKLSGKKAWGVALPLAGVMLLHGLYDFGLVTGSLVFFAGSLLMTLGISSALFVVFLKAGNLDRERGISVVGNNAFCRSCGFANPHHYLYCVHCGKNA